MAYIRFYNPYYSANRDESSDAAYDKMTTRFSNSGCNCQPAANVTENEKDYLIEMALPGVDKTNIVIKHEDGLLHVDVEKKEDTQEKYNRQEFDYSGTGRVFKTGDKINPDLIEAKFENGILTIRLPKKEAFFKKPAQTIQVN